MRSILFIIALALPLTLTASSGKKYDFSPTKSYAKVNFAKKAPLIDGVISPGEYAGSYENYGLLKHNSSFLASRQGRAFAALDEKYLYFAMVSNGNVKRTVSTHDGPVWEDDSIELYPIES